MKKSIENYDAPKLKAAIKKLYPRGAVEVAEIIGKSGSWVSSILSKDGVCKVNEYELKLLCGLARIDYEDILTEEEPKEVEPPKANPSVTLPIPAPQVVINQSIALTDEQFTWVKDAYQQLRADERKRHEELMTSIANCGRIITEIYNRLGKVNETKEQV